MDVRDQILRYEAHINDNAVALVPFEEHGLVATVAAAVELAGCGATADVVDALLFVCDVALFH